MELVGIFEMKLFCYILVTTASLVYDSTDTPPATVHIVWSDVSMYEWSQNPQAVCVCHSYHRFGILERLSVRIVSELLNSLSVRIHVLACAYMHCMDCDRKLDVRTWE